MNNKTKFPMFIAANSCDIDNIINSSSGGVFFEFCKEIIKQEGIVYGAVQEDVFKIVHKEILNIKEAEKLRGSKYLRSEIGTAYINAKKSLENGKIVLFSGTGCQIAGLYKYLKKDYDNLFTCEVICHGVPLKDTLKRYIEKKEKEYNSKLKKINYRDKRFGWSNNCISEKYENGVENCMLSIEHPVHKLYLKGINMNGGCSKCQYGKLPRIADITLGDFWQYDGYLKEENNNRGISLLSINNDKGNKLFENIKECINYEYVTKEQATNSCRHLNNAPLLSLSNKLFKDFINRYDFDFVFNLFDRFGEIVSTDDLYKFRKIDKSEIERIFLSDTQDIIYIMKNDNKIDGIITYGEFVKNYEQEDNYINYNFKHIKFSEECLDEVAEIFEKYPKINRIPVLDNEGRFIFEIRKETGANGKHDIRKALLILKKLSKKANSCFYFRRPSLLSDFKYKDKELQRINNGITFSVMQNDIDAYKSHFQEIFGEKFSEEYIEDLSKISPIVYLGGKYKHLDVKSKYVNVVNGYRITENQPEVENYNVHIYGRCGVFGYAVEDRETVCSYLQNECNKKGIKAKVINHGLWGADDELIFNNIYYDINNGKIGENDVVILYMDFISCIEEIDKNIDIYDTTEVYHKYLDKTHTFYDRPGHMTAKGYKIIAKHIFETIKLENICKENKITMDYYAKPNKENIAKELPDLKVLEYFDKIQNLLPMDKIKNEKTGAIVMNCNPFTRGHRYLIEKASKCVDNLIIFVLEEDKSYFSFKDRFNMVKIGTKDLDNVYVVPSGKFIVSSLTFPEYFLRNMIKDSIINASLDVDTFGKYIAPHFNISVRFVGSEPLDKITCQYNKELLNILPKYNIKVEVFDRLKINEDYISASKVRAFMESREIEKIKKWVLDDVYEYIKENVYLERGKN